MAFDPTFVYGNYVEGGLWASMGVVVAARERNRRGLALAAVLLAFGASDLVETRTGGWYTPWWMLAWKTAGVLGIVAVGAPMLLTHRKSKSSHRDTECREKNTEKTRTADNNSSKQNG